MSSLPLVPSAMTRVLFLVLFVSLSWMTIAVPHVCIHSSELQSFLDKNNTQSVELLHVEEADEPEFMQQQTSGTRQNIRFAVDYSNINDPTRYCTAVGQVRSDLTGGTITCTAADIFTTAARSFLVDTIIPAATTYLSMALRVNPITSGFLVQQGTCGEGIGIPAQYSSPPGVQNADYLLVVTAAPVRPDAVLAFAGACSFVSATGRPVVGLANFNPTALATASLTQPRINTAIHEIMHALGFTGNFWATRFPSNPVQSITIRGKTTTVINSPRVLEKVRTLLNCSTLQGAEIEDQGGSGTASSHWEKHSFLNEMMTGVTFDGEVPLAVSEVTLAVFEDSGHYDVNYAMASPPQALWVTSYQSLGCGFSNQRCDTTAGGFGTAFCFDQTIGCSTDFLNVGQCNLVEYSTALPTQFQYMNPMQGGAVELADFCPFTQPVSTLSCVDPLNVASPAGNGLFFGNGGRCYATTDSDGSLTTGGLRQPSATSIIASGYRCIESRCVSNVLQVRPGGANEWYQCPEAGGPVSIGEGFLGRVVCPASSIMCPNLSALNNISATSTNPTNPSGGSDTSNMTTAFISQWILLFISVVQVLYLL